jgi:hypothetical protein
MWSYSSTSDPPAELHRPPVLLRHALTRCAVAATHDRGLQCVVKAGSIRRRAKFPWRPMAAMGTSRRHADPNNKLHFF